MTPARPGETFTMETDDPFWWNAAGSLWVTAEKAGIRTATMFGPDPASPGRDEGERLAVRDQRRDATRGLAGAFRPDHQ
ncbi:hypothetical protein AB5I41_10045 [Sphingomonas sp. MMS24-JH45]